ncbi:MAG: diaminopimelate decarboxylase [Paenibacillus sp.]|jgi:diaminopimelate decarboxylase|nr:diaminopimelate decarboxylase [Paenibacillus sp.]
MERIVKHIHRLKDLHPQLPVCAFLYDLERLQEHVLKWKNQLPPPYRFYYAIKANSEAAILKALAPIVDGFEVASLGEVCKVRAVDKDIPIIFGGPGKTDGELEGAIDQGVSLIHVESFHEIEMLAWIALSRQTKVDILLRVNLKGPLPVGTLQMAGVPTQFGVDESQIDEAIGFIRQFPQLRLKGFHLHSLSNNLDDGKHAELIAYYLDRFQWWKRKYRLNVTILNVGGGIGVNYERLDKQFSAASFTSQLVQQLTGTAADVPSSILFECGRYSVASCGYYAAEVLDIREREGTTFVVIAGGLHHFLLPGAWKHNHPFEVLPIDRWPYPFPRGGTQNSSVTIVGRMNSHKDVLARDVFVPNVRIGDVIVFTYAGAYGWSISAHDFSSLKHPDHIFIE